MMLTIFKSESGKNANYNMKTQFQTLLSSENVPLGPETMYFYQKEHVVDKK